RVKIPASMKGQQVVALIKTADASFHPGNPGLGEGGESLVYVNGEPYQGLDRNRDEIYLVEKAKGGETLDLTLEACPSARFDIYHIFMYADFAVKRQQIWDFYWDCQVVHELCQTVGYDSAEFRQLAEFLNSAVKRVDLQHKGEKRYLDSIARV